MISKSNQSTKAAWYQQQQLHHGTEPKSVQATLRWPSATGGTHSRGKGRGPGAGRGLSAPARLRAGGSHTLLPSLPGAPRPWSCGEAQKKKQGRVTHPDQDPHRRAPAAPSPGTAAAPPPPGTYFPEPLTPITTSSTMAARRSRSLPLCPPAPPAQPGPARPALCPSRERRARPQRGREGAPGAPPPARPRHCSPSWEPGHPGRVPRSFLVLRSPDLLPTPLCLKLFSVVGCFSS